MVGGLLSLAASIAEREQSLHEFIVQRRRPRARGDHGSVHGAFEAQFQNLVFQLHHDALRESRPHTRCSSETFQVLSSNRLDDTALSQRPDEIERSLTPAPLHIAQQIEQTTLVAIGKTVEIVLVFADHLARPQLDLGIHHAELDNHRLRNADLVAHSAAQHDQTPCAHLYHLSAKSGYHAQAEVTLCLRIDAPAASPDPSELTGRLRIVKSRTHTVMDTKKSAATLAEVLANSYALMLKTQAVHWNIVGNQFYGIHNLTEMQYTDLFAAVDEIAERIRTLDEVPPATLQEFSKLNKIAEGSGSGDAREMLSGLIDANKQMGAILREAIDVMDDLDDYGSEDLLVGRLRVHEKATWMLNSVLKEFIATAPIVKPLEKPEEKEEAPKKVEAKKEEVKKEEKAAPKKEASSAEKPAPKVEAKPVEKAPEKPSEKPAAKKEEPAPAERGKRRLFGIDAKG